MPSARVTTIVSSAGALSSRALSSAQRSRVRTADVTNPSTLARMLQDMQDASAQLAEGTRTNPHAAPCIVRGVQFTSGVPAMVRHRLGRAWTGWWICRYYPNGSTSATIPPETAYQAGLDARTTLPLLPGFTGTVDLCITGD